MDQIILLQIRREALQDELHKIAFHINVPEEIDALKGAIQSKALSTAVKAPSNLLNSRKQQDGQIKLADIDIGHDQQLRTSRLGAMIGSGTSAGAVLKELLNHKVNIEKEIFEEKPTISLTKKIKIPIPKFIIRAGMKRQGYTPVMKLPNLIKKQLSEMSTKSEKLKLLAKIVPLALGAVVAGGISGGITGSLGAKVLEKNLIKKNESIT